MLRGHCMGVTHHKRIARISLLVDDLAVGGTAQVPTRRPQPMTQDTIAKWWSACLLAQGR